MLKLCNPRGRTPGTVTRGFEARAGAHLLLFEGKEVVDVAIEGHVWAAPLEPGPARLRGCDRRLGVCTHVVRVTQHGGGSNACRPNGTAPNCPSSRRLKRLT